MNIGVFQRVEDFVNLRAGNSKDMLHATLLKCLNDYVGACLLRTLFSINVH
jgi:hypothetical protein